jgi:hypothetical protein
MRPRVHAAIDHAVSPRRPATVCAASLLLLVLLGWLDYITGDYSLIIFYLIPVGLASWFVGKKSGLVFCLLSFVTRISADEAGSSFSFMASPLHYWNLTSEFLFLLIMSLLCSALRASLLRESRDRDA